MKNILLALLCLFSFSLAAQVERMPSLSANYNAAQSGGGSGFWQLTGTFSDAAGIYDASGVAVGDVVFFSDGMYTFFLPVTEVVSATHPTLIVKVSNVGITQISSVPSGMKAIFHPTSKGYFPFVSGISNADQQNYNEYLMSLLDQAGGGKINKRYFADEANLDLTDSVDLLGSFNNVIIDIRRASGSGSVTLPVITDTLRHTIITVQAWVDDGGTPVGVFSGGETFIDGYAGGAFTDDLFLIVRNGEKVTLTPVFDGIWYWSTHISKPSTADGNGIYSGSDSLSQTNTYAAMAADGSQVFALGSFPDFPDNGGNAAKGLYINPTIFWEEISLNYNQGNNRNQVGLSTGSIALNSYNNADSRQGLLNLRPGQITLQASGSSSSSKYWKVVIDSLKFEITRNISGTNRTYQLLPPSEYPSTTSGVINILKWTAGVPSFGLPPNIYNEDNRVSGNRYVKTSPTTGGDLFIGYFGQSSTNFNANTDRKNLRGFYISPDYQEGVGIISKDSTSQDYTSVYLSPYSMTLLSSEGTKYNTISIGNNSSSSSTTKIIFAGLNSSSVNYTYSFPTDSPSNTSGVASVVNWLGTGSAVTPRMSPITDVITGTARIVPYMNTSGRFVTGNTYFKVDTNITSGAQAKVRLLINNPNGDAGEGDSYSALSVRAGDGLGTEAIFNIGDQAATMGTTGYGSVFQLSRSGGNFTTKSNLTNGLEVGKFAWRGYVNGGSRALGHIQLNYTGDGTTYNSDLIGASAVSGSVVSGWKLDNQSRFWLGSGADDYHFPTTGPSNTTSDKNILIWTGTGSTPATPAFGTITGLMVDGQFTTGTPTLSAFGTGTAQRYIAVVELTSGASANTDIPLPTANVGTFGKSILISPRDLNTTYNINATGSIELNGASTASVILTKPTEFVCNVVSVGPTTYRWVMVDNATSSGSSSASTDGSGDVVITHNKNHTSYVVDIQGTGATLGIGYTITAKTATTFTVRAYDTGTKVAIASTGVTFDWIIKE